MPKTKNVYFDMLTFPLITVVAYFLTKNSVTKGISLQITLLLLLILLGYTFFIKGKDKTKDYSKSYIYLLTTFFLFLIGSTGWSFSPFFFVLYLLAVMIAFVFSMSISLTFVAVLVVLFSFSIGEVDLAYDFMVVLSLVTVLPLSYFLRKEYIRLKQASKEILILEEQKKVYKEKVDEILANRVNNFSVNIRQPINDAKQLSYMIKKTDKKAEVDEIASKVIATSDEALRFLEEFEEDVTGKKLLSSPKKS